MATTLGGAFVQEKAVWDPGNYRGVHFTAQLAKVVELLLGIHLDKFFSAKATLLDQTSSLTGRLLGTRTHLGSTLSTGFGTFLSAERQGCTAVTLAVLSTG